MSLSGRLLVWRAARTLRVANSRRRRQLMRELADYRTAAECLDLERTLDRYPDGVTAEIRDILSQQQRWNRRGPFPGFSGS
jgi:hypothetical protein